jgi:hypothetical protein
VTSSSHTSLRRLQAFQRAYRNDRARVLVLPLLRDGSVPGRRSSGLVRSLRRRGARGAEVPGQLFAGRALAVTIFGLFTAILYTELHHSVTEYLDRARCVDTPGELHATAAHPQRAPAWGVGGASGRQPAPEAERSSIRTRNGPVLLKTKSPKCSLCRRTAGSFERKRSLEPGDQRRRRSVRAFPF